MSTTHLDNEPQDLGTTLGFLLLRLWLSLRAIVTGLEKYAGTVTGDAPVSIDGAVNAYGLTSGTSEKVYGLAHYHGVPEALMEKFETQPLIPSFALGLFDTLLGPTLILFGITLLLGIATRISLFVMGLLYLSLTLGLILIKQDGGIAWLGIHIVLISFALFHVKYNRFALLKKF
jgi:thiosulfate dehydrogenase [quinone] large subunit